MSLYLRKVSTEDMDLLFKWANDDLVRKNAFHTEKIPYDNHVKWFAKMMADDAVYQYILYDDTVPIGQIRLNVEGCEALVDYSICAEQRGKGFGVRMLDLIKEQVVLDKIAGVTKITGQVKYNNRASARAFERCGFSKKELAEYLQYEFELKA